VTNRFLQYTGRLHVSVVTVGELMTWALRANAPPRRLQGVEDLLKDVVVLDVTEDTARKFGELRAGLLDSGRPTPEMDLLIAASALVHGLTLVTQNVKDFVHISGLAVEDWVAP
jgi:tRNA(fMet)-specific endonuclease VapC